MRCSSGRTVRGPRTPLLCLPALLALAGCEILVTFDPRDFGDQTDDAGADVEIEADAGDDGTPDEATPDEGDAEAEVGEIEAGDGDGDGEEEVEDGGEESSAVCGNGTIEPPDEDCELGGSQSCVTGCGPGTQDCGDDCRWLPCQTGDLETCNAADDDCDGATDEDFPCIQLLPSDCTTTCGSTGSTTCSDTCTLGSCTAPPEICNGRDDDCVGGADDVFDCVAGSSVSCTSTCGTIGTGTCTSSCEFPAAADCTPPPERCGGGDDDCDGQTDEGLWAPMPADVRVTSTSLASIRPSLAWNGTARRFGLAWEEEAVPAAGGQIYLTLLTETGTDALAADAQVSTAAGGLAHEQPSLVWSGTQWAVVWSRIESGASELHFRWVAADGGTLGGDVQVTSAIGFSNEPALIWVGTEYGLYWNDARDGNREIYFVRLTSSGSKPGGTSDERLTASTSCVSSRPSLAWTGTEYGVVWYDVCSGAGADPGDIWFTRVSAAGAEVGGAERGVIVRAGSASSWPRLVANGSGYAMAWLDDRDGSDQLYFARLNTDGVVIGTAAPLTTPAATTGVDGYAALAWDAGRSEYLVVWSDQRNAREICASSECGTEIYFARLDPGGSMIGAPVRVTVAPGSSVNPSLAAVGDGYGVVWVDERDAGGGGEVYFNALRCR